MRYVYTVEIVVDDNEFDGEYAEDLRKDLYELAELYPAVEKCLSVKCQDEYCLERNSQ